MNEELVYRGLTLALLVTIMSISATFRRRADREGGALQGENGLRLVVVLRLLSLLVLLPLLGYLINPVWVAWARLDLPVWARWLGAAGGALAVPLATWVLSSIGTNISPSHATRAGHQLITHGPYRWVRHPLYSAGLLLCVSLTLLTALWTLGVGMLIPLAVLLWRTPREEARLVETFGEEYRAYMRRTGRFFPRILTASQR
ncbi:MAG TPA: isoprenylcysteine carboxylmethyltransferase family protein [Chloroflexaceae bacterium]|nr:isoprenylcysteine carboxylmethyltransferase family protein [Chloroflexaceae bacterium]